MVNITHRVGIKAPLAAVYAALSTAEGIATWWTRDTMPNASQANQVDVQFSDVTGKVLGSMSLMIVQCESKQRVQWNFIAGPVEWIGTDATFDLKQEGDYTIVLFGHNHWREYVEFMAHCSMKWATFLLSLKELSETGVGRPSPADIKIDNWN